MNVKISYTVPLENIPSHLRLVLDDASNKLQELSGILAHTGKEMIGDPLAARRLDEIRKGLAAVDFLIADCYSIHTGYVNAQLNSGQQDVESAEQDAPLS